MVIRKNFTLPNSSRVTEEIQVQKNFRSMLGAIIAGDSSISVFAHIVMGLIIKEDNSIGTMAVTIRNGVYELMYSPDMVSDLTVHDCSIVLAHEMGHLALSHVARILRITELCVDEVSKRKYRKLLAIAADCAVNSWLIDDLAVASLQELENIGGGKYKGVHPSQYDLEAGRSMEWYLDALLSKLEQVTDEEFKSCSEGESSEEGSEGESDDESEEKSSSSKFRDLVASKDESKSTGSLSSKLDSVSEDKIDKLLGNSQARKSYECMINEDSIPDNSSTEEVYQNLVKDAGELLADATQSCRDRGIEPGRGMTSLLESYAAAKVSWKDILRRYTSASRPACKERSISRPKRNAAYLGGGFSTSEYPGKKKLPTYNIVFAIDTSGSVNDADIELIFNELEALNKDKSTTITVVECDSKIHRVYELEGKGKKVERTVWGRGGTDFDPVFNLVKNGSSGQFRIDGNTDLLIYATDGYCSFPKQENRINQNKVIWLTTTGQVPSEHEWGVTPDSSAMFGITKYGRFISIKN